MLGLWGKFIELYNLLLKFVKGWREIELKIVEESTGCIMDNLFVHMGHEDFNPCFFGPNNKSLKRMMPPGEISYFYSNSSDEYFVAKDQPK